MHSHKLYTCSFFQYNNFMLPIVKAFWKLKICVEKFNNIFNAVMLLLRQMHLVRRYLIASSPFCCCQGPKGK